MTSPPQALAGIRVVVVTVSDRRAAGERTDETGPLLADCFEREGAAVERRVVSDDIGALVELLTAASRGGADAIITTGGTGVGPRDITPEATAPFIATPLPGIPELLRQLDGVDNPRVALGRGLAGLTSDRALIVNLPGSLAAVRTATKVLPDLIRHVAEQCRGGDH